MIGSYNIILVIFSFVMAAFASFTALGLTSRIPQISGKKVYFWISGGGFAMGTGIWAMHFIGMLAFHLPVPVFYDIYITGLSALLAIAASTAALFIIKDGSLKGWPLLGSAGLMGSAISGMHYTGMSAMKMSPPIQYDPFLVVLSILIAVFASLFALKVSFSQSSSFHFLFSGKIIISASFMGIAIAGMHYTAMAAADFDPNSICLVESSGFETFELAASIIIISSIILSITLLMIFFDIKLAEQNAILVSKLQINNAELSRKAEELALSMTEQLRKSAEKDRMLATIVEQSEEAIITVDTQETITSWNDAAFKLFGYSENEALGKNIMILNPMTNQDEYDIGIFDMSSAENYQIYRKKNDLIIYVNFHKNPLYSNDGSHLGFIYMLRDISERLQIYQKLNLWGAVIKNLGEAILISDANNNIIHINNSFTEITGYQLYDVYGKNPRLLASGRHSQTFYTELWDSLLNTGTWKGEIWNKRKNGEIYPEWLTLTTIKNSEGKVCNYIAIFTDITNFKEKEQQIKHLAYHDKLTGLANRSLMEDRLNLALTHAKRIETKVGVLFLDLDKFKFINDSLGHHSGDELLIQISSRLKNVIRSDDTICRQGGDEFIIIIHEVVRPDDLGVIAEKIKEELSEEFNIFNETISISTSIGISVYPDDGYDSETLIKNADTAMYHAKSQGRGNFQFFTIELNTSIQKRLQIERDLSRAISRSELYLVFQPQINLENMKMIGFEVLVRWKHREMGEISPAKFIPIAEETGFIHSIGDWILDESISQFKSMCKNNPKLHDLNLAVNISAKQIENPEFLNSIQRKLKRLSNKINLEFEITETAVMTNLERNLTVLRRLESMGIHISIDDFGTGYSSLSYLKLMPIHRLKIDRSFIRDITQDESDSGIVETIIQLGRILNLEIIAEGTESKEQLELLKKCGCNQAQGFYFSEPLTLDRFMEFSESRV